MFTQKLLKYQNKILHIQKGAAGGGGGGGALPLHYRHSGMHPVPAPPAPAPVPAAPAAYNADEWTWRFYNKRNTRKLDTQLQIVTGTRKATNQIDIILIDGLNTQLQYITRIFYNNRWYEADSPEHIKYFNLDTVPEIRQITNGFNSGFKYAVNFNDVRSIEPLHSECPEEWFIAINRFGDIPLIDPTAAAAIDPKYTAAAASAYNKLQNYHAHFEQWFRRVNYAEELGLIPRANVYIVNTPIPVAGGGGGGPLFTKDTAFPCCSADPECYFQDELGRNLVFCKHTEQQGLHYLNKSMTDDLPKRSQITNEYPVCKYFWCVDRQLLVGTIFNADIERLRRQQRNSLALYNTIARLAVTPLPPDNNLQCIRVNLLFRDLLYNVCINNTNLIDFAIFVKYLDFTIPGGSANNVLAAGSVPNNYLYGFDVNNLDAVKDLVVLIKKLVTEILDIKCVCKSDLEIQLRESDNISRIIGDLKGISREMLENAGIVSGLKVINYNIDSKGNRTSPALHYEKEFVNDTCNNYFPIIILEESAGSSFCSTGDSTRKHRRPLIDFKISKNMYDNLPNSCRQIIGTYRPSPFNNPIINFGVPNINWTQRPFSGQVCAEQNGRQCGKGDHFNTFYHFEDGLPRIRLFYNEQNRSLINYPNAVNKYFHVLCHRNDDMFEYVVNCNTLPLLIVDDYSEPFFRVWELIKLKNYNITNIFNNRPLPFIYNYILNDAAHGINYYPLTERDDEPEFAPTPDAPPTPPPGAPPTPPPGAPPTPGAFFAALGYPPGVVPPPPPFGYFTPTYTEYLAARGQLEPARGMTQAEADRPLNELDFYNLRKNVICGRLDPKTKLAELKAQGLESNKLIILWLENYITIRSEKHNDSFAKIPRKAARDEVSKHIKNIEGISIINMYKAYHDTKSKLREMYNNKMEDGEFLNYLVYDAIITVETELIQREGRCGGGGGGGGP